MQNPTSDVLFFRVLLKGDEASPMFLLPQRTSSMFLRKMFLAPLASRSSLKWQ